MRSTGLRRTVDDIPRAPGRWCRFSAYEVRDHYVQPVRGAQFEHYDPWGEYLRARREGGEPPYQSLLALYGMLSSKGYLSPECDDVSAEGARTIEDWCPHHGLLGILPHMAYDATLALRWVRTHPSGRRVVLCDSETGGWSSERFTETWAMFFPAIPPVEEERFPYGGLMSRQFWKVYAEPVDLFLSHAGKIWQAALLLSGKPSGMATEMALDALRPLVRPVGLSLIESGSGFRRAWSAPSLLGWLGLMIVEDLAEHSRGRRCRACQTPFFSTAYQARYCSERCRQRVNMRKYRKRLAAQQRKRRI